MSTKTSKSSEENVLKRSIGNNIEHCMVIMVFMYACMVTNIARVSVHCRESAGTGPINLKVVPNECCLGRSP